MAAFTFAIVVPLASPNKPVATSKHDIEHTLRPLDSSEPGAFRIGWMMVLVERGVNKSIEACAPALARVILQHRAIGRAPLGTEIMQRTKLLVQMHNSPNRERYLAPIALSSPGSSRQAWSGEAPFREPGLPRSARSRFSRMMMHARDLDGSIPPLRQPA